MYYDSRSNVDILVPWKSLNGTHRRTAQYTRGSEQRIRSLAADDKREVTVRDFSAYGGPLEMVTSFKYLGQVILAMDNDWPEVARNLARAKTVWRRMSHILSREGATPKMSGLFYKAVYRQYFSSEQRPGWSPPAWARPWGGFQTQVVRRLTQLLPQRTTDGTWNYTSAAAAREAAVLLTMEEYVRRRQNTVAQYIVTRSLSW